MSGNLLRRSLLVGAVGALLVATSAAACERAAPTDEPDVGTGAEPLAPRVIAQVLRQRTTTIRVLVPVGGSGGRAEVSGPVEYTTDGVGADLTGTISGRPVHLIMLGDTVYASGLFELPAGTTWLQLAAGGERGSDYHSWVVVDEILTALTYAIDENILDGLAYNAAPPESMDGVTVRTAVRNATWSTMMAPLHPPQFARYQDLLPGCTGARIMVLLGDDATPRRLVVTFTGDTYYPTTDVTYSGWDTTAVAFEPPSGPEVLRYP